MQWEGITEFVYVAEAESFTQASRKLAISTAQVSRQVSALEKRLNIKLFHRTTRKVSLSEEGRVFYQHCRGVLDALQVAEQTVTNMQSKPHGKIKLTAPVTYGEQRVLPLVNDFMCNNKDVQVSAYLSNQQFDLIEGGYDLAIRLGKLEDSSMIATSLGKRTNYVCASAQYLNQHGTPTDLPQLKEHACLLGSLDYWHFQETGRDKKLQINPKFRYNSGYALVDAAVKGLGIVQLPDYYVQPYIKSGQLISLLDNYRAPDDGIWALYPQSRHLSPKIRLLLDYLKQNIV